MQAIIRTKAGKEFSTMQVQQLASPRVQADEVKVRMKSSRINPVDMDLMKGMPFLRYKTPQIGGVDGAGTILEVGANVKHFKVGDAVYFYRKFTDIGTWAEEITIKASNIARVPAQIDLAEAGAIALPLLTAFDCLSQLGAKKGERILVHGAGGGVGFQAVQVAKKMGLYVVGTANQNDQALLKTAGLDRLIDYKNDSFADVLKAHDVDYVLDVLGGETLQKSIALKPKKIVSVRYIEPKQMYKAGMNMPRLIQWIMKKSMRKFDKAAAQNGVQLIGQVTGANGEMLQQAINFVSQDFVSRTYSTLSLSEIAQKGLSKTDIGKVILF